MLLSQFISVFAEPRRKRITGSEVRDKAGWEQGGRIPTWDPSQLFGGGAKPMGTMVGQHQKDEGHLQCFPMNLSLSENREWGRSAAAWVASALFYVCVI